MLFTDIGFWAFFAAVFAACWALPARWRWAVLLAANAAFYVLAGSGRFLPALALPLLAGWGCGLWLERARAAGRRTLAGLALAMGIACSAGCLLLYKYLPALPGALGARWAGGAGVPLGISYFTLQNISYLADVASGRTAARRHLGHYAVSVSFFVLLLIGPIERPAALLPQLERPAAFDGARAERGLVLVVWGLFEKLAIANIVGSFVDAAFGDPAAVTGTALLIAAVLYAFQIYADFAGCSDMARGAAALLGLQVTQNFRRPYFAEDLRGFWGRWHVSLSSWLRDYIYIPLGGSRHGLPRTMLCLLATFALSGLWHGAGACFLAWGLLHGAYQCIGRLSAAPRAAIRKRAAAHLPPAVVRLVRCGCVFVLVDIAWVFFRVGTGGGTLAAAWGIFAKIAADFTLRLQPWKDALVLLRFDVGYLVRVAVLLAALLAVDIAARGSDVASRAMRLRPGVRLALGWLVLAGVLLLGVDTGAPIYFQF